LAQKLPVKDVLAALDMNAKNIYNELDDSEKKQVAFWLLNRYMASVQGNREKQELAVFKTNEYYNKNYNEIQSKHKNLLWQLLCISGNTGKIEYHPWIGFKKKTGGNNNAINFLQKIYPNMKLDEIELLATQYTKKELKQLAEEYNIDIKL
jgi:hypothetical protein